MKLVPVPEKADIAFPNLLFYTIYLTNFNKSNMIT